MEKFLNDSRQTKRENTKAQLDAGLPLCSFPVLKPQAQCLSLFEVSCGKSNLVNVC